MKKIHQNDTDSVRELDILKNLSHPNLIKIVDDFMKNGKLCIVLEKAECGLNSRPRSPPQKKRSINWRRDPVHFHADLFRAGVHSQEEDTA